MNLKHTELVMLRQTYGPPPASWHQQAVVCNQTNQVGPREIELNILPLSQRKAPLHLTLNAQRQQIKFETKDTKNTVSQRCVLCRVQVVILVPHLSCGVLSLVINKSKTSEAG